MKYVLTPITDANAGVFAKYLSICLDENAHKIYVLDAKWNKNGRKLPGTYPHNPEVVGSSPASATISSVHNGFDRCGHSIFSVYAFYSEETVGLGAFLLICCIYQIYLL